MHDPVPTPAPQADAAASAVGITLAGGCFWCLEAVFLEVRGVRSVHSGYANGHTGQPDYESVCSGTTGYAEVVQITWDPAVTGLDELLQIFFVIHDPTTLNRQGHDVGTQYRSGIYWHDEAQRATIDAGVAEAARAWAAPLVTEVAPLRSFWPAEAYHQRYFERHPQQGYCRHVVAPKLEKFRATFAALRRG